VNLSFNLFISGSMNAERLPWTMCPYRLSC